MAENIVGIAGNIDNLCPWPCDKELIGQLLAIHSGHDNVCYQQVNGLRLELLREAHSFNSIARFKHLIACAAQYVSGKSTHHWLIVY